MIYTITLNPAIDRLIKIKGTLTKKRTNRAHQVEYDLGGKGLHVSNVLTKFNMENKALGYIGETNRPLMENILAKKNICHHLLVEDGASTRECIVVMDDTNAGSLMITENGFHVSKENHSKLIDFLHQFLTEKDIVVIAGSMPPNYTIAQLLEIINTIKNKKCFIACDLSGEALAAVVDMGINFIKPNQYEVEVLFQNNQTTLIQKIKELAIKIDYVVVSLGKDGSYVAHKDNLYQVTSPTVEERNDTGAGDVFVGSFIAQFVQGKDLKTIMKYATGCSASKVTKHNSTDFDIKEAESYFNRISIKKLGSDEDVVS
ncbi:1-phosphofructokinase family hexose kinase [Niallia circulans]|uniref:Tagatose-6-phosphate kinase n=1 Tax=Niallia circulans TaxID=1397 RepID=A0A941JMP8_NIACI|nr:1-phosphofructokinase family hexose kinase [Niallia circulans]MCB5237407.1 1-phosphofructokinase family hexose kinase [Niallia circulans]